MLTASMVRPFVSLAVLVVGAIIHQDLPQTVETEVTESVVGVYVAVETIIGIIKNHR